MKSKFAFSLITLFLFSLACSTFNQLSKRNLAFIYNPESNRIKCDFIIFHKTNNNSILYYQVKSSDILYAKPFNSNKFKGGIKISYKLLDNFDSKEIIDSSSVIKYDSALSNQRRYISDSLSFKTPELKNYILHITLTDINKRTVVESFINIEKSNPFSSQNFLIRGKDNLPVFKNYFASWEAFSISVNDASVKKIIIKHYTKDFPIALPAFSLHTESKIILKSDSTITIDIINGKSKLLNLKTSGVYYLQIKSDEKYGMAIFRFYDDYPEITTSYNMLYPLMYITTKNEFDRMLLAKDKKAIVDNFWIDLAGNPNRAKEIIVRYYTRVREANTLFTSYEEGWKTDRGIIYIIYGLPNVVYKNTDSETWIYGSSQSSRSIVFTFHKLSNPFSNTDFSLNRSANYKNSWYNAVENWRR